MGGWISTQKEEPSVPVLPAADRVRNHQQQKPAISIDEKSDLTETPWRTFPDEDGGWTQTYLDKLKGTLTVVDDCTPANKNVRVGKIVLIGQIQSGKSSFINSAFSVEKNRLAQKAPEGEALGSLTLAFNQFNRGQFLLCDTMGLENRDGFGFNTQDIVYLVNGNIPRDYKFDSNNPVTEQTPGFNKHPKNVDRVHCVVFCVDATQFLAEITPVQMANLHSLQTEIQRLRVPRILLLTKIDKFCKEVNDDITKVYNSIKIRNAVNKASEIFKMPKMYIHPVKNFTDEARPELEKSILLLIAFRQALRFAQDCIEELNPETDSVMVD